VGRDGLGNLRGGRPAGDAVRAKAPAASAARYPIRAVSRLTGVGIDTLRAWERRYQAVTPARDDRGRMYSDADVARLRLIREAVSAGHAVGRVAALGDAELRRLAAAHDASAPRATPRPGAGLDSRAFDAALRRLDSVAVDREFTRLASVLPPLHLVRDVIMPSLRKVGDAWEKRRGAIAHEHLVSATMRHLLGSFLRLHARDDAPVRLLFATPSGDRHEIGILGGAMLAATAGLGVSYVGPDLPAREIVDAASAAGAGVLVLGVTLTGRNRPLERELGAIIRGLPADVELWVAGPGARDHLDLIAERGLVLLDFDDYQQQLDRLTGRSR
jgi:DNA-binding transcriptional MerR regulator/methylmalonyl-CoA mutase cobalamin-binding subunit